MKYYYTNAAGQSVGPVDLAQLSQLASTNAIHDGTPVIAEGASAWMTYGQIRQSASQAAAATAVASGFSQAALAVKSFSWGEFFFGILLVILSILVLPWTLIRRAARELADWGRSRAVPSANSDLPVLTVVFIVVRPVVHVVVTFLLVLSGFLALFGLSYQSILSRAVYGYAPPYSFPSALGSCFLSLLLAYFVNVAIGYLFESLGLMIRVANDINKLARR